ncbi:hypothetical protein [Lentibacter sp.]|uniref:hypothetical protein n=1 Tax=Lentibacter sp. TaxID=2024994 RepID=UPI003F696C62
MADHILFNVRHIAPEVGRALGQLGGGLGLYACLVATASHVDRDSAFGHFDLGLSDAAYVLA